jgi:hypothetical protein
MSRLMVQGPGVLVAALVSALGSGPALADSYSADVQCLATYSYIIGNIEEPTIQQSSTLAAVYFAGKLAGSGRDAALEDELLEIFVGLDKDTVKSELARCSVEVGDMGRRMKAMSASMSRRIEPPPAPQ